MNTSLQVADQMLDITSLDASDPDFAEQFSTLLIRGSEFDANVEESVRRIIQRVRTQGDQALLELTQEFDRYEANSVSDLEVPQDRLRAALAALSPNVKQAIEEAAQRIRKFHEHQLEDSWELVDEHGSKFGQRVNPIERVGIYVPGGRAAYPSSVLMTAIPARVAGVRKIVMTVPAPDGEVNDLVLAAAHIAGVDQVFLVGGAQAVAALAYGTQTVPRVDKIVGPGNAYVSAAKRQVFGQVGIDLIAGPSEVVVVCDESTHAEWAAMDMFAQAEHDVDAQSILLSTSKEKISEVRQIMENLLPEMERRNIIEQSLAQQGALIHVANRDQLLELIHAIAPEHLELLIEDADAVSKKVSNAGAIFVGQYSAEVLGDYCAGPNHVLPTSGAARFSSALGVYDFLKRTSIVSCTRAGASVLAELASTIAREEQLQAHACSAEYRRAD